MIQLKAIDKYIESRFQRIFILKGIDLTINEGEFITLMGPSGAGKSTLLNILGLLDEDYAGEYFFGEKRIKTMKDKERSNLHKSEFGYIFQAYHLIDELTVYENIETPLLYRNVSSSERKSIIANLLDRFNMVAKKRPFPCATFRRTAAIGRDRPSHCRTTKSAFSRRADRQFAFSPSERNHGDFPGITYRRHHHHPGNACTGKCRFRNSINQFSRR